MAEKQLYSFELPNGLKWNTDQRRIPRPTSSPSSISHSSRLESVVHDRAHVPYKFSADEKEAMKGLECMNINVVRNEKVDVKKVKKKNKGKLMKMKDNMVKKKVTKKEENVCGREGGDVVKNQNLVIKIPYKDVVSKGKEVMKFEIQKSEGSKEVVWIEEKKKYVASKSKETDQIDGKRINLESKGKNVMTFEGEKNEVESNCKEPIIKEVVEANKREIRGKGKEVVKMERNVERKDGKHAAKEEATDFVDGIDEVTGKSWNLRSGTNKSLNTDVYGSGLKATGSNGPTSTKAEKGKTQPPSNERDIWERLNVSIALTPREIEEDLYAMGAKTSKRVKKRPKHVQNLIDASSPGNNLTNISADRYNVSANSMNKQD